MSSELKSHLKALTAELKSTDSKLKSAEIKAEIQLVKAQLNATEPTSSKKRYTEKEVCELIFDQIVYNVFDDDFTYTGPSIEEFEPGEKVDADSVYLKLRKSYGVGQEAQLTKAALAGVAKDRSVYANKEYMSTLDPVRNEEVEHKLYQALGIENDAVSILMLDKWMIGAVSRALNPGCDFHLMLILQGAQGCGKSSFLKSLVPDLNWYVDDAGGVINNDLRARYNRHWIVETGEVETAFGRIEAGQFKQFISSSTDKFRRPYGSQDVCMPRSFVLAGTTNESRFLTDETGNRRFAVIKLTKTSAHKIDNNYVTSHRDLIWGTYLARVKAGETCTLTATDEALMATVNKECSLINPLKDEIMDVMETVKVKISCSDLKDRLNMSHLTTNSKDWKKVLYILDDLGYEIKRYNSGRFVVKPFSEEEVEEKVAPPSLIVE